MGLEEWLAANAARAARALANPTIRAEVLGLVSGSDQEAKRRLEVLERELSTMEWRLRYSDLEEAEEESEAAEQP